jgi:hypothetical protein
MDKTAINSPESQMDATLPLNLEMNEMDAIWSQGTLMTASVALVRGMNKTKVKKASAKKAPSGRQSHQ